MTALLEDRHGQVFLGSADRGLCRVEGGQAVCPPEDLNPMAGLAIPGVPAAERTAVAAAGVRVEPAYRTNLGAPNTSVGTISLAVKILDQHGTAIARRFTARYCI